MAIISFFFLGELDIFEAFRINKKEEEEEAKNDQEVKESRWGTPAKIGISLAMTLVCISPPVIGWAISRNLPGIDPAYVLIKSVNGTSPETFFPLFACF